ncbi:hypothetical protein N656DRAFT_788190 [Canariomyces notabilis]|uniref:tRNA-intron lyase n=1 Tax=Canariomyces notabilis TaxID=2074819 RepID=A0AAN6THX8_9PEZI|nr:hypothetical protein N656DRAFT_788190 [Canariomyces arenarius]
MAETATITTTPNGKHVSKIPGLVSPANVPGTVAESKAPTAAHPAPPPRTPLNQIYVLPAPIRTFPLPAFYPHNPVSLLHLAYVWLSQIFRPPPPEPSVVHVGVWDPETRSVHVKHPASIRALWEQGFYGKGSLSRSEPNWLKRELARRGSPEAKTVSELRTESRREERRLAKWERAKAELEAVERQRLAEAELHAAAAAQSKLNGDFNGHIWEPAESTALATKPNGSAHKTSGQLKAPVGPMELLSLPNSSAMLNGSTTKFTGQFMAPVGPMELLSLPNSSSKLNGTTVRLTGQFKAPVGPMELLSLPNSLSDLELKAPCEREIRADLLGSSVSSHNEPKLVNDDEHAVEASAHAHSSQLMHELFVNGDQPNGHINGVYSLASNSSLPTPTAEPSNGTKDIRKLEPPKRRKSVRFSPNVESTTFQHSDPPNTNHSPDVASKVDTPEPINGESISEPVPSKLSPITGPLSMETAYSSLDTTTNVSEVENKEHFQLSPEEAFFLVFSLGALSVVDPVTASPIPPEHLLRLFRSYSYFPPRSGGLRPDDPFLVNYAVYHHFRSLGWVPRHGIKFGVDWILYQRGPVFDHSEFGIMILPAFSDPAWAEFEHEVPKRSWSWLMGVNRVLSHVLKSLVLVYVDIPTPIVFEESMERGGIAAALKKYTIREVMVRRFSVNRNR